MAQNGQWYVVQTLSGKENKAKETMEKRLELEDMQDSIFEILVPSEKVSEVRDGKKITLNRKFFPGYILVNVDLVNNAGEINEDTWYFIKNTQGIINFLGGESPVALSNHEVDEIMNQLKEDTDVVKPKIDFTIGEIVKVKDGPFNNFDGNITNIDPDRGKLEISVSIFGRATPLELEYWQVEKT